MENCTRYDCMETTVGAMILASGVVCPPFNDTECLQVRTSECERAFVSISNQTIYILLCVISVCGHMCFCFLSPSSLAV